jgi:hypothetical protein
VFLMILSRDTDCKKPEEGYCLSNCTSGRDNLSVKAFQGIIYGQTNENISGR